MGHDLYRMIRDCAPPDWTSDMRVVALMIADDARDPGQGPAGDGGLSWSAIPISGGYDHAGKWHDGLTERTGLRRRAISRALTDLARAGYEMREALGRGKDGRVVFTAPGRGMRFRVPLMTPRDTPERSPDMSTDTPGRSTHTASVDGGNGRQKRRNARQKRQQRSPVTAPTVARYGDPLTPYPPRVTPRSPRPAPMAEPSTAPQPSADRRRAQPPGPAADPADDDFDFDPSTKPASLNGQRAGTVPAAPASPAPDPFVFGSAPPRRASRRAPKLATAWDDPHGPGYGQCAECGRWVSVNLGGGRILPHYGPADGQQCPGSHYRPAYPVYCAAGCGKSTVALATDGRCGTCRRDRRGVPSPGAGP